MLVTTFSKVFPVLCSGPSSAWANEIDSGSPTAEAKISNRFILEMSSLIYVDVSTALFYSEVLPTEKVSKPSLCLSYADTSLTFLCALSVRCVRPLAGIDF